MELYELYELNQKIRKGEATNQEKENYSIEYKKIKEYYMLTQDSLYPLEFKTMILPEYIDNTNYDTITKYIDIFKKEEKYGEWHFEEGHKGIKDNPIPTPYTTWSKNLYSFVDDVEKINFVDYSYLDNNEIIKDKPIEELTIDECKTKLTLFIRGERFCEGLLLDRMEDGTIIKILERIKELDERKQKNEKIN